jgi:uncharacterized protein (TIGR00369 family)
MTPPLQMENPAGVVQGGFLAAMSDTAMAAAAVTASAVRAFVANTELSISFLRPARVGQRLTCTARVLGGDSQVKFVEATITGPEEILIAKASSTYVLTPRD